MKTNKEIVTEIIEDLENTVGLNWPTRSKIDREKLLECWSGNIVDWKFYGYTSSSILYANYKKLFSNITATTKGTSEKWKLYILRINGYKVCTTCNSILELIKFSKNSSTISGRDYTCKKCKNIYYNKNKEHILNKQKELNSNNKEHIKKYQKQYRDDNKDTIKSLKKIYYINNKDTIRENNREWVKNNPGKANSYKAKYRAAKLQRTPSWFSKEDELKIQDLYTQAQELEKIHGIKYHVDHEIPLQGELVSGLHVPNNLRVIPAEDNLSKSNTYIIG